MTKSFKDVSSSFKELIHLALETKYNSYQDRRTASYGQIDFIDEEGKMHLSGLSSSGYCLTKSYFDKFSKLYPTMDHEAVDDTSFDANMTAAMNKQYRRNIASLGAVLDGYSFEDELVGGINSLFDDYIGELTDTHGQVKETLLSPTKILIGDHTFSDRITNDNYRVTLTLDGDTVSGHYDSKIRINNDDYLIEQKAMQIDTDIWKEIKEMSAKDFLTYFHSEKVKSTKPDIIRRRIYFYLCQMTAYILASTQMGQPMSGGLLTIKNTSNRDIHVWYIELSNYEVIKIKEEIDDAIAKYNNDKEVKEKSTDKGNKENNINKPTFATYEHTVIDYWYTLIDALRNKKDIDRPNNFMKSGMPCTYCEWKDICY